LILPAAAAENLTTIKLDDVTADSFHFLRKRPNKDY